MRLSVIIPAYNEAATLRHSLPRVLDYLARQPYESEVIVVDDGSADGTAEVAAAFPGVRVLGYPENRGKGFAVRAGLQAAAGAYRLFFDADGSTSIEQVEKLWPPFESGADVVIGSRALPGSDVQIHQAWYRENMGRVFNLILRSMRLTRFRDTQCGFKAFTARACETLLPRQTIERFSFDAELLHIAEVSGLRVEEVPVHWRNRAESRVHPLKDAARMFWDLVRIRWKDWRGAYR